MLRHWSSYVCLGNLLSGCYPGYRLGEECEEVGLSSNLEFCPRCQSYNSMEVAISLSEEADSEGNLRKIITKNYHCLDGRSFLRSEDIEAEEGVRHISAEELEQLAAERETRMDENEV